MFILIKFMKTRITEQKRHNAHRHTAFTMVREEALPSERTLN